MSEENSQLLNDADYTSIIQQAYAWLTEIWSTPNEHHGLDHAITVERLALQHEATATLCREDRLIVQLAALLHDIGYARRTATWSPDNREHIQASLEFISTQCNTLPFFRNNPDRILLLLALVAHHDDTNYAFPSNHFAGYVQPVELGSFTTIVNDYKKKMDHPLQERYTALFSILCEADALAATGNDGARRTHAYSVQRGIPLNGESSGAGWIWEESVIGNIRLGARRGLLDATSTAGHQQAIDAYYAAENYLTSLCDEMQLRYSPETLTDFNLAPAEGTFILNRYQPLAAIRSILRNVALLGDSSVHPYAHADITIRHMPIADLHPIARYALNKHLIMHQRTAALMQQHYALSIFDLPGLIDFTLDDQPFRMSPPIIETLFEPALGYEVSSILDGLHRIMLARTLGLTTMCVIDIRDIPASYPNIALPCAWNEVQLCDEVPPADEKRHYRFASYAECMQAFQPVYFTQQPTPATYRYFWYRDLAGLGSAGVRHS